MKVCKKMEQKSQSRGFVDILPRICGGSLGGHSNIVPKHRSETGGKEDARAIVARDSQVANCS